MSSLSSSEDTDEEDDGNFDESDEISGNEMQEDEKIVEILKSFYRCFYGLYST